MKKLKKLSLVLLAVFLVVGSVACSKVPAGYRGIKVYLLGGSKGVESEELGIGRYWIGINEELFLFPTFTQNYVWTQDPQEGSPNDESITFQTKEGLDVNADIGISYRIDPKMVSVVFQKYRRGVEEITDVFLRNMVRDGFTRVASSMDVDSVYGEGKESLIDNVQDYVAKEVEPIGIVVEKIYLIGKLRMPQSVTDSIALKIKATQKAIQAENEVREAEAEARKAVAKAEGEAESTLKKAAAQAKANRMISASLTNTLVKYKALEKWNGVMPYMVGGDGMLPMISIPKDK